MLWTQELDPSMLHLGYVTLAVLEGRQDILLRSPVLADTRLRCWQAGCGDWGVDCGWWVVWGGGIRCRVPGYGYDRATHRFCFFVEATITILNCIYIYTYHYISYTYVHCIYVYIIIYIYRRAGACSAYPSNSWNIPSISSILALEWGNNNIYPLVI